MIPLVVLGSIAAGCAPMPPALNVLMISSSADWSSSSRPSNTVLGRAESIIGSAGWLARRLRERGDMSVEHVAVAGSLHPARLDGVNVVLLDNAPSAELPGAFVRALMFPGTGTASSADCSGVVALGLASDARTTEPGWCDWLGGRVEGWGPTTGLDLVALDPAQPIMLGVGRWLPWVDAVPLGVTLQGGQPFLLASGGTPAAWTHQVDSCRVVALAVGSNPELRGDEDFVTLVHNAIRWSAGKTNAVHNRLSLGEQKAGYELMFDGCELTGWTADRAAWSPRADGLEGRSTGKQSTELTWRRPVSQFTLKFWYRQPAGEARLLLRDGLFARSMSPSSASMPASVVSGAEEVLLSISAGAVEGSEGDCVPAGWNEVTLTVSEAAVGAVVNGMPAPKRPRYTSSDQPGRLVWSLSGHPPGHLFLRDLRLLPLPRSTGSR